MKKLVIWFCNTVDCLPQITHVTITTPNVIHHIKCNSNRKCNRNTPHLMTATYVIRKYIKCNIIRKCNKKEYSKCNINHKCNNKFALKAITNLTNVSYLSNLRLILHVCKLSIT